MFAVVAGGFARLVLLRGGSGFAGLVLPDDRTSGESVGWCYYLEDSPETIDRMVDDVAGGFASKNYFAFVCGDRFLVAGGPLMMIPVGRVALLLKQQR